MRTKGLVVGLLLSSMVVLAPMRANCVSHENANNFSTHAATVAKQMVIAQKNALMASQPKEECYSYVQVFNSIDADPEHAQARAVTASYDIR